MLIRSSLVFSVLTIAACLYAQSSRTASDGLNDQEQRGKHLFLQRCSVCHLAGYGKVVDWKEATATPAPFGPRLAGVLKGAPLSKEQAIRAFILKGTAKMPGFQYALIPKQVDDLVAYVKTL